MLKFIYSSLTCIKFADNSRSKNKTAKWHPLFFAGCLYTRHGLWIQVPSYHNKKPEWCAYRFLSFVSSRLLLHTQSHFCHFDSILSWYGALNFYSTLNHLPCADNTLKVCYKLQSHKTWWFTFWKFNIKMVL